MNLILLFPEDFLPGTTHVRLKGRRFAHIQEVQRAHPGNRLCVGLADGKIGSGKILEIEKGGLRMDVSLTRNPPKKLPLTLILALPRPPVLKRVLLTATSLGVPKIVLLHFNRVEKTFWQSSALREGAIRDQLILGLEQSKDTTLPEVILKKRFKPFVEDELPHLIKGTMPLMAHPESKKKCPTRIRRKATLVIGPEGGFVPFEIEKLKKLGFIPVCLGKRILRIEPAVVSLISKLF